MNPPFWFGKIHWEEKSRGRHSYAATVGRDKFRDVRHKVGTMFPFLWWIRDAQHASCIDCELWWKMKSKHSLQRESTIDRDWPSNNRYHSKTPASLAYSHVHGREWRVASKGLCDDSRQRNITRTDLHLIWCSGFTLIDCLEDVGSERNLFI